MELSYICMQFSSSIRFLSKNKQQYQISCSFFIEMFWMELLFIPLYVAQYLQQIRCIFFFYETSLGWNFCLDGTSLHTYVCCLVLRCNFFRWNSSAYVIVQMYFFSMEFFQMELLFRWSSRCNCFQKILMELLLNGTYFGWNFFLDGTYSDFPEMLFVRAQMDCGFPKKSQ